MQVANQVGWYQRRAENNLLAIAQELKDGLCITHDKAMDLAKRISPANCIISKWKE